MKICMVSNLYSPYVNGGAEIAAERLSVALSRRHQISVITGKPFNGLFSLLPRSTVVSGVKVWRFYPLNLFYVYFAARRRIPLLILIIWRVLDMFNLHSFWVTLLVLLKDKPDLLHAHNLGGLSYSVIWSAKLLRIPVVHTLHDYHLICPYSGLLMCSFTGFQICNGKKILCNLYSGVKRLILGNGIQVVAFSRFSLDKYREYGFFRDSGFQAVIPHFMPSGVSIREASHHDGYCVYFI